MNKPIPNQPPEETPPELYDDWEETDQALDQEEDNAIDAAWTEWREQEGGLSTQEVNQLLAAIEDDEGWSEG